MQIGLTMARKYKRDLRGRFARGAARRTAKKKSAQQLRIDKRYNKSMSKKAVKMGIVNKKNARILRKNANAKAKARYKTSRRKKR